MECWWDCITQTTFLHLSIAKGMKWNASLYHWFVAKVISFIQVTVQVFLHHHVISQFFFPNTDHALWASQICSFSFDFYTSFKSIPQWLIFWNLRISDLYNWNSKGSKWRIFSLGWNKHQVQYFAFNDSKTSIKRVAILFVTIPAPFT